ncbi:MAG: PKD domain-containing protein [Spirochaetales bacterium]|nr:PKD domain-containing protein [Spirochaetales bacterium]
MKRQYVFLFIFLIVSGALSGQDCTARFTYSIINKIKNSVMIKFTSTMKGSAKYLWDFGDGINSDLQHPVHTYIITSKKDFTVTLKVTSGGCSDKETQTLSFSDEDCSAAFTYEVIKSDKNSADVRFTVSEPVPSASYRWSFGDGKGTKKMNPTHRYKVSGEKKFTVKLTVKAGSCEDKKVQVITLKTSEPEPAPEPTPEPAPTEICTADFIYEAISIAPSRATVRFTSKMGDASKYEWSFGDGKNSTDKNPVHVYVIIAKKVFEVTLSVVKSGCTDKKTKTITIGETGEVAKVECSADFSFEIKKYQGNGGVVQFTSAMTGASSYKWDFGDGHTSMDKNPSNVFDLSKTRIYTVTLEVKKDTCTDKKTKKVEFPGDMESPGEKKSECTAEFSYTIIRQDNTKGLVQFASGLADSLAVFDWDFGDGIKSAKKNPVHTYDITSKQQFQAVLKVTKGGCSDTQKQLIDFKKGLCTAEFTVKIVYNDGNKARVEVTCKASTPDADFTCNFGDGTISKEWNPVHTYNIALKKKYTITLRVRKGDCDDQSEQGISF